jgi:hypothetical protein
VAYYIKARSLQPVVVARERQHILNKQKYTTSARERLDKYFPAATDTHAREERCFLRGPCRDVISKGKC